MVYFDGNYVGYFFAFRFLILEKITLASSFYFSTTIHLATTPTIGFYKTNSLV
jgi:hypothetical protein